MDDEEIIRDVAKEMLESEGYNLEFAIEGREAIDMYKKSINIKQKFDLVILDLTIPGGLGGKDAIKEILKIDPDVKAIVSSGYSNDPIMAEYTKYGFSDFVPKPYNFEQLINIVNKVISI
jgi:DNA-binding NtrC family response regulator